MTVRQQVFRHAVLLFVVLAGLQAAVLSSYAIDAPHDVTNDIGCSSRCHIMGSPPAWFSQPTGTPTIDYTSANNLCKSCHVPSYPMGPKAQDVQTHSSAQTSTTYGAWVMECRTCHDPHFQKQVSAYPTTTLNSLATGTILSIAPTRDSMTVSTTMTPSAFQGFVLVPDIFHPSAQYRIADNDATTIMISPKDPFDAAIAAGDSFAVRYPGLVRDEIATPNSGTKAVRFFNNEGPNSFATSTATVDGICQVCHTKTKYFTNDGAKLDQGHMAGAGANCTTCHPHRRGFAGGCDTCHGNPPVSATMGGPGGLADNELGTGSLTAGAHQKHAADLGFDCATCHTGGMPASQVYDKQVQIGFSVLGGAFQSGTYDGRSSLANGYTYTSGNGGTTVTQNGAMGCASIYCHSNAKVGTTEESYASPVWYGSSLTCSSCHGTPPAYSNGGPASPTANSHPRHVQASSIPCDQCHYETAQNSNSLRSDIVPGRHVDGNIQDVFFDPSANPSGAYSGAGKSCSSVSCHGYSMSIGNDMNGGTNISPVWGSAADGACGTCHGASSASPPVRGSHVRHVSSADLGYAYACTLCHDVPSSQHVDNRSEVAFSSDPKVAGASYSGTAALLDAYGNCSSTYCHSTGVSVRSGVQPAGASPPWGSGVLICNACHGNAGYASPNDGMPNYANGAPKENSHPKHVIANSIVCANCHADTTTTGSSIASTALHANGSYDAQAGGSFGGQLIAFTYTSASPGTAGACSNISCHGGSNANAAWGASLSCRDCHLGPADVDDFTGAFYNNGVVARIRDSGEWDTTGHGRSSGVYPGSSNSAAGFTTANACLYCHDGSVAHKTTANPFRLRNFSDATWGRNGVCQSCHATGSSGVTVDAVVKNAVSKVDSYHNGSNHTLTANGGQFCWDCHDGHGDGNIFMVHDSVASASDAATGAPTALAGTVFIANATGTDFARSAAPFNGICNVCHTLGVGAGLVSHYSSTFGDGHNSSNRCVSCHGHSQPAPADAFKPSACDACHAYPPQVGDGKPYIQTTAAQQLGKGAHQKHVGHLTSLAGVVLSAPTDTYGGPAMKAVCGVCHDVSDPASHMTSTTRQMAVSSATYSFGATPPQYNSTPLDTVPTNKTCSNVSCHFVPSPAWQQTAGQ